MKVSRTFWLGLWPGQRTTCGAR